MKVLLASIAVFLGLAGLGVLVVFDGAQPTRSYVAGLVPDDFEDRVGDSRDSVFSALRFLTDHDDPDSSATSDDASRAGQAPAAAVLHEIAGTAGIGVSLRSDCSDEARIEGGLAEGAAISIISAGVGDCEGWILVESDATAARTWVRDRFVAARPGDGPAAAPPALAAAPAPPAATPSATPTAPPATSTSTPTPTPTPTPTQAPAAPAVWFGEVSGSVGDTVSAWINGEQCASTTVYDKDGRAFYYLPIAEDSACGPTEGATVTFTVNGTPATSTGAWTSGAASELPLP